ncbi:MAG: GIY-YIG nuclease family protein [Planctomycetota bacterium]
MAFSHTIRRGFSVNVFLPAGDPEGIKVVEKSNWTGRGLVIPRPMFAESRARPELDRTGVYLLVGPSETSSLPALYVGEGDPVKPRLDQHARNKDFWTHAVVFTSKDSNLNKAHVQRLESRLVELASAAKRSALENGNMPAPPSLSEAEEAFAEGFLDDILLCLPILGYALFESAETAAAGNTPSDSGGVTLYLRAKGIEATGADTAAGFVVRAGSKAVSDDKMAPSTHANMREMREELIRQKVLIADGDCLHLVQDYLFASPSLAAGVMLGRPANGRVEWKAADGRTLKDIQDAATVS